MLTSCLCLLGASVIGQALLCHALSRWLGEMEALLKDDIINGAPVAYGDNVKQMTVGDDPVENTKGSGAVFP